LYAMTASLYWIRSRTRNQWRLMSASVIWSLDFRRKISRAATVSPWRSCIVEDWLELARQVGRKADQYTNGSEFVWRNSSTRTGIGRHCFSSLYEASSCSPMDLSLTAAAWECLPGCWRLCLLLLLAPHATARAHAVAVLPCALWCECCAIYSVSEEVWSLWCVRRWVCLWEVVVYSLIIGS